jgi:hypothetical protein
VNRFVRKGEIAMKKIRHALLFAATLAAFSALSFSQEVNTDYDKHTVFERYHTYTWGKVQTSNPLWEQRIKDAVDKELQAKGWRQTDSDPDVTLVAVGSTRNQQEYQTFYNGLGGWRWGGFGDTATTTVNTYKVGTLVLDMYDSRTKQLIWRGTASDTLSDNPEHNEKNLQKAVDKMFKKFPPNNKS